MSERRLHEYYIRGGKESPAMPANMPEGDQIAFRVMESLKTELEKYFDGIPVEMSLVYRPVTGRGGDLNVGIVSLGVGDAVTTMDLLAEGFTRVKHVIEDSRGLPRDSPPSAFRRKDDRKT